MNDTATAEASILRELRKEPLTEGQIAHALGMHRITARTALADLKRRGLVSVESKSLIRTTIDLWRATA